MLWGSKVDKKALKISFLSSTPPTLSNSYKYKQQSKPKLGKQLCLSICVYILMLVTTNNNIYNL